MEKYGVFFQLVYILPSSKNGRYLCNDGSIKKSGFLNYTNPKSILYPTEGIDL